jgi:hypothetical protein
MPTCIYCRRQDPEFDREHVIPEAFGTFEPTSFILYETVCKDCNNHFGRTLDLVLSRDSMEALLRFRYGIKPASKAGDLPYRKLRLKVSEPGPWFGATVELQPDRTGQRVEPVPVAQAAFRWKEQDWKYLLETELTDAALAQYVKAVPGTLEIRVFGIIADHARIVQRLKDAGINFQQQGSFSGPLGDQGSIWIEVGATVDQMIFRAIAKIAFNYMTHEHGADFALRSDFDDVRNYIRYLTPPRWSARMPVVVPVADPILFDDERQSRQTNGHLLTFDLNEGKVGFEAQVSLFNTATYRVRLCPVYSGIIHSDFQRGHHFDIEERTITPLFSSALLVNPRIFPLIRVMRTGRR